MWKTPPPGPNISDVIVDEERRGCLEKELLLWSPNSQLLLFNISSPVCPQRWNRSSIDWLPAEVSSLINCRSFFFASFIFYFHNSTNPPWPHPQNSNTQWREKEKILVAGRLELHSVRFDQSHRRRLQPFFSFMLLLSQIFYFLICCCHHCFASAWYWTNRQMLQNTLQPHI